MNKVEGITQRLDFPPILKGSENKVKIVSQITDEDGEDYDGSSDTLRVVVHSPKSDETTVIILNANITKSYDASTNKTSSVFSLSTLTQEIRSQSLYELQNMTQKIVLAYGSLPVIEGYGFD